MTVGGRHAGDEDGVKPNGACVGEDRLLPRALDAALDVAIARERCGDRDAGSSQGLGGAAASPGEKRIAHALATMGGANAEILDERDFARGASQPDPTSRHRDAADYTGDGGLGDADVYGVTLQPGEGKEIRIAKGGERGLRRHSALREYAQERRVVA